MQPDWEAVENFSLLVIPAKAGTRNLKYYKVFWVPAFAGMIKKMLGVGRSGLGT